MLTSETPAQSKRAPNGVPHAAPPKPYVAKKFDFSRVEGLSQHALEIHRSLYEGYVKETNALLPLLNSIAVTDTAKDSQVTTLERLQIDGLMRRFGFERNGMLLHELFFASLCGQSGAPNAAGVFTEMAENSFGSIDAWMINVRTLAQTRGVGWVLTVQSEQGDRLHNLWIDEHQHGLLAEGRILLAFDLWEHAFLLDYKPTERLQYLQVVFDNIDWDVVEGRVKTVVKRDP